MPTGTPRQPQGLLDGPRERAEDHAKPGAKMKVQAPDVVDLTTATPQKKKKTKPSQSTSCPLSMEEKLKQWKEAKQNGKSDQGRKFERRIELKVSSSSGVKRKVPGAVNRTEAMSTERGRAACLTRRSPLATVNQRKTAAPPPGRTALRRTPSPNVAVSSAAAKKKPRPSNGGRSSTLPLQQRALRTPEGNPALDQENRQVSPNQSFLECSPVIDTKIQKVSTPPQPPVEPLSSPRIEENSELLAKQLVKVAINFEKKHWFPTAFSVFKRALLLLPGGNAKLSERLTRIREDNPEVVNQESSQDLPTAVYMQQVLERHLMTVLNTGSKNDLKDLYKIGGKRAELILAIRPLQQLEDLQRVHGLTANAIATLHSHHTNWENHL